MPSSLFILLWTKRWIAPSHHTFAEGIGGCANGEIANMLPPPPGDLRGDLRGLGERDMGRAMVVTVEERRSLAADLWTLGGGRVCFECFAVSVLCVLVSVLLSVF